MPNQQKRPPVSLRLPEGLEAWYRAEASKRGMALNALAVQALTAFRDGPPPQVRNQAGKPAAKPPEPTRTVVLGYSKEQQTRGRR